MEISSKTVDLLRKYNVDFDESLFRENQYLHCDAATGDSEEVVLLRAKRLLLNEPIDRIVNTTLRNLFKEKPPSHPFQEGKPCRNSVDSRTLEILGTVPAPKHSLCIVQSTLNRTAVQRRNRLETKSLLEKIDRIRRKHERIATERNLVRKYFKRWRSRLQKKGDSQLEDFFQKLEIKRKNHTKKVEHQQAKKVLASHLISEQRRKEVNSLQEKSRSDNYRENIVQNDCLDSTESRICLELNDNNIKKNIHDSNLSNDCELEKKIHDSTFLLNDCEIMKKIRKNFIESKGNNEDGTQKIDSKTFSQLKVTVGPENSTSSSECFENRYKAQQDIITMQKLKLLEQERVIQEIKHGQVCEDLNKSIKESRLELSEMLRKCSIKTKVKVGAPNEHTEEMIEVQVKSAPKIVQRMERRASERAAKREAIQERKRVIDEERKRLAEEMVEGKKKQDEEEKRRSLEMIKERRRKELEAEKSRRTNKMKFLADCVKADGFFRRKLKRRAMLGFKRIVELGEDNHFKGEIFYEMKLERKCFVCWKVFIQERDEERMTKAKYWYTRKLLQKCLNIFVQNYKCAKRNYQVACDYYDFRLQCRTFEGLYRFTCKERMRLYKLYIKAVQHYNCRILLTYFYQWKSLKAVLVLEKAKEEKKKKWRERVLQILPDYRPPIENDF